ncbi:MAG: right-handed parallel beta-helix repeat-containing protein [Actinomycetota bacterium]|nr:right-handed parallel beta-helix repeat-containing protein [Actinomycetota bacterium]
MQTVRNSCGLGGRLALAVVALFLATGVPSAAAAATVSCGQVITRSTTLAKDVGPCVRNGIVVGADHIVIDLAGHEVFGTGVPADHVGIKLAGRSGVVVKGGTVTGFGTGVAITKGSRDNTVAGMNLHDNVGLLDGSGTFGDGVGIFDSSDNLVSHNTVNHNGPFEGIGVFGNNRQGPLNSAHGNRIEGNLVENNTVLRTLFTPGFPLIVETLDEGINLGQGVAGGNATTVADNIIRGNGLNGIDACSIRGNPCVTHDNVIVGNVIIDNGFTNQTTTHSSGELGKGINLTDITPDGNDFSPPTHDLIEGNFITHNASTGLFLVSSGNEVRNNVVEGNGVTHRNGPDDVDLYFINNDVNIDCVARPPVLGGNVLRGNVFGTISIFAPNPLACLAGNVVLHPPPTAPSA